MIKCITTFAEFVRLTGQMGDIREKRHRIMEDFQIVPSKQCLEVRIQISFQTVHEIWCWCEEQNILGCLVNSVVQLCFI